ncbi:hypothetical protein [Bradyrhizobium sp. 2S1]|uniref:hypothetical protein n=1 Tax=Bradyrhizobium sp. 2S1 TaxID=1404429 RepID=UPI00140CDBF3|nr:hypothetical protein [Bradyrhizobium sp. 2S1]MCK7667708.1 hypothetical protein [Bradyrhizobium sp. 2S1]
MIISLNQAWSRFNSGLMVAGIFASAASNALSICATSLSVPAFLQSAVLIVLSPVSPHSLIAVGALLDARR